MTDGSWWYDVMAANPEKPKKTQKPKTVSSNVKKLTNPGYHSPDHPPEHTGVSTPKAAAITTINLWLAEGVLDPVQAKSALAGLDFHSGDYGPYLVMVKTHAEMQKQIDSHLKWNHQQEQIKNLKEIAASPGPGFPIAAAMNQPAKSISEAMNQAIAPGKKKPPPKVKTTLPPGTLSLVMDNGVTVEVPEHLAKCVMPGCGLPFTHVKAITIAKSEGPANSLPTTIYKVACYCTFHGPADADPGTHGFSVSAKGEVMKYPADGFTGYITPHAEMHPPSYPSYSADYPDYLGYSIAPPGGPLFPPLNKTASEIKEIAEKLLASHQEQKKVEPGGPLSGDPPGDPSGKPLISILAPPTDYVILSSAPSTAPPAPSSLKATWKNQDLVSISFKPTVFFIAGTPSIVVLSSSVVSGQRLLGVAFRAEVFQTFLLEFGLPEMMEGHPALGGFRLVGMESVFPEGKNLALPIGERVVDATFLGTLGKKQDFYAALNQFVKSYADLAEACA